LDIFQPPKEAAEFIMEKGLANAEKELRLNGFILEPPRVDVPKPTTDPGNFTYWHKHDVPLKEFQFKGRVFTDGSASKCHTTCLNRAGWAAIQMDEEGNLEAALAGPVLGHLAQTNPCAEHTALAQAALRAADGGEGCRVAVDFIGAKRVWDAPRGWADPKGHYSAFYRGAKAHAPSLQTSWVHSHQDLLSMEKGTEEWKQVLGNSYADEWAKKGADLHTPLAAGQFTRYEKIAAGALKYLRHVAITLANWADSPPIDWTLQRKADKKPKLIKDIVSREHAWTHGAGAADCATSGWRASASESNAQGHRKCSRCWRWTAVGTS